MRKIEKTVANLETIAEECRGYVDCLEGEERIEMSVELDHVKRDWYEMVTSGVFYEAVGRVVENADTYVIVDEDR